MPCFYTTVSAWWIQLQWQHRSMMKNIRSPARFGTSQGQRKHIVGGIADAALLC
jgi:hypothetical protein